MRLDITGKALCGTEGVGCWECIGTVLHWSAVWEDEGWVVVAAGATVATGAGKQWESPWCHGSPWSSGGFWALWELEGRRTLGLSHPKIWIGRLSPKPCRPGKMKHKLESPCSPPWQTCPLWESLRQETDCVRLPEESSIVWDWGCWFETVHLLSHSWLREDEWDESQTGPEDEIVPEFCWTEKWNGSFPVCECRQLLYCWHSTPEQSGCAAEVPTEVQPIKWPRAPASWCAERSLEERLWQGHVPGRSPSHAGLGGPTRERGTISGPTTLGVWGRGTATMIGVSMRRSTMAMGTRDSPAVVLRARVAYWAAAISSQPLGRRWWWGTGVSYMRPAVFAGLRPITCRAPGPGATVRSLFTGLMLSPWCLSVTRGTQLLQLVGVHIPLRNRRTLSRLGWSIIHQKLYPVLHRLEEGVLPVFHHYLDVWRCSQRRCCGRKQAEGQILRKRMQEEQESEVQRPGLAWTEGR